ncbi:hypothetical protein D8Y22_01365 [Salinadaptatus halalkaliphilus]|uniref:DUF2299 domain-containing protein n=1 Tax=Salinadaptatus halalkaliphilus TaxID=2419781 RepID=A0A4S3TR47_9EURY|nr:DUF5813 family protein [Salinadaptatus halalkaliphilus]THE66796.1 hypothetical protein D8Y22_01365 [Salinadaptatus halalkaliphilus]
MTDAERPSAVERELERHDAFEPADDTYRLTTTVFDAAVDVTPADGARDGEFAVTVTLPTLDNAVAGERVATAVEDGWYETLKRRLADIFTVAQTTTHDNPTVSRDDDTVTVRLEYTARDAGEGVADAKTLVEFVEGTYAQGIIPGYEYRGPAGTLLENAQQRGEQADGDAGGMPM